MALLIEHTFAYGRRIQLGAICFTFTYRALCAVVDNAAARFLRCRCPCRRRRCRRRSMWIWKWWSWMLLKWLWRSSDCVMSLWLSEFEVAFSCDSFICAPIPIWWYFHFYVSCQKSFCCRRGGLRFVRIRAYSRRHCAAFIFLVASSGNIMYIFLSFIYVLLLAVSIASEKLN